MRKKKCAGCADREEIIVDLHWMARRYADERMTYAPGIVNRATNWMIANGIMPNCCYEGSIWARDGMGRDYDKLTDAQATPGTPEAKGEIYNAKS